MNVASESFHGVIRAASRVGPPVGGKAVMFITPSSSSAVRAAALGFVRATSSRSTRPAWLIDLDFRENGLFHHLEATAASPTSEAGRAFSVAFKADPIYKPVGRPDIVTKGGLNPAKLLTLHEVPNENFYVSRFRVEAIADGQRLALSRADAWWTAARARTDWITIHALPLEEGAGSLSVCRDVDGVVLVIEADRTSLDDVNAMHEEVEAAGGRVLGAVMVGVGSDARWLSKFAA